LPGVTTTSANCDPAAMDDRNITPALAHGSELLTLVTRAVTIASPEKLSEAKLNWSAEVQISAPPPATVQLPPENEAKPATPGVPMSESLHPLGSDALGT